jgi:hypothetical protein
MQGAAAGAGRGIGRARRAGRLVEGIPSLPGTAVVIWEALFAVMCGRLWLGLVRTPAPV